MTTEHCIHEKPPELGFNNMGKPVPQFRRDNAYQTARSFGCSPSDAWGAVEGAALALEHDHPHEAMGAAMKYVDLSGAYRLLAELLVSEQRQAATQGD